MRLIRFLALTLLVSLFLAACGADDANVWTNDPEEAHDEAAASPTPEPTPTTEPTSEPETDPREVLFSLIDDPENPDHKRIYDRLSSRFQVIEYDERWVQGVAQNLIFMPDSMNPKDWQLEEHDTFTMVRHPTIPEIAQAFVVEDGEWRWDPGTFNLLVAAGRAQAGDQGFDFGMNLPDDYQMEYETDPQDVSLMPMVHSWLHGVGVQDNAADVVLEWEIHPFSDPGMDPVDGHLMNDTLIPLDGLSWQAGGQSGDVEVVWTTAILEDDQIRLPGWPEEAADIVQGSSGGYPMMRYHATLRLLGIPDDADEITLRTDEIVVGPFGEDAPLVPYQQVTYSFEHRFPAETTHDILAAGEP